MKRAGLAILTMAFIIAGIAGSAFTEDKKPKVLILPFEDRVDRSKYTGSEATALVILNSLYTFIGIIPSIDVPDKAELLKIKYSESGISNAALANGADAVIYGSYSFEGDKYNPTAKISFNVWIKDGSKVVLKKDFSTPTDVEIFDSIDEMIKLFVQDVMKTSVNVAYIRFGDFKIGDGQYEVFVNNKLLAQVTNEAFSLNLRVLADNDYHVVIKKAAAPNVFFDRVYRLRAGSATNLAYLAQATLNLAAVSNKNPARFYTVMLNGKEVKDGSNYTQLQAGIQYNLQVLETMTNVIYSTNFYLADGAVETAAPYFAAGMVRIDPIWNKKDGAFYKLYLNDEETPANIVITNLRSAVHYRVKLVENGTNMVYYEEFDVHDREWKTVTPIVGGVKPFAVKVLFNDSSIAGAGLDYFFIPTLWAGAMLSFSMLPLSWATNAAPDLYFLNLELSGGWYFLGYNGSFFRSGVMVNVRPGMTMVNDSAWNVLTNMYRMATGGTLNSRWSLDAGLYLVGEIQLGPVALVLKAGTEYDFLNMALAQSLFPSGTNGAVTALPFTVSLGCKF